LRLPDASRRIKDAQTMKKIEMIRCAVRSPNKANNTFYEEKSLRFVPLEIFRLWRYLMEQVKKFEVSEVVTGYWMDEPTFSKEKGSFGNTEPDPVFEVFFTYTRDTKVGRPVIRYFPKERFERIMEIFLGNFSEEYIHGGTRLTRGFFVPIE